VLSGAGAGAGVGGTGKSFGSGETVYVDKHVDTDSCFVWCYWC